MDEVVRHRYVVNRRTPVSLHTFQFIARVTISERTSQSARPTASRGRVMLIDDDAATIKALRALLTARGYETAATTDVGEIDAMIEQFAPEAIVLDYAMPQTSGMTVLGDLRGHDPTLTVVMLSGEMDVPLTVRALRAGAEDVLLKPVHGDLLTAAVDRGLAHTRLLRAHRTRESDRHDPFGYFDESPAMSRVLRTVEQVAFGSQPVLLLGEPGTGKRALAQLLHQRSSRVGQPFAMYLCAPHDSLQVEHALLGSSREHAPTDIDDVHDAGLLHTTNGGTLVLDEPQTLSAATQAALLHTAVTTARGVGVRLVVTTRRDLADDVRRGVLRADLYRQLSVMPIMLPPLRNRGEFAIRELAERFLRMERARMGNGPRAFAASGLQELYAATWPGNVRQLHAVVDEAFAMALDSARIDSTHVRAVLARRGLHDDAPAPDDHTIKTMERQHIARVLTLTGGQRAEAARLLGITRTTLYKKIDDYQLEPGDHG